MFVLTKAIAGGNIATGMIKMVVISVVGIL